MSEIFFTRTCLSKSCMTTKLKAFLNTLRIRVTRTRGGAARRKRSFSARSRGDEAINHLTLMTVSGRKPQITGGHKESLPIRASHRKPEPLGRLRSRLKAHPHRSPSLTLPIKSQRGAAHFYSTLSESLTPSRPHAYHSRYRFFRPGVSV